MASTTPNMGLTRWDDTSDYFSHAVLANNFAILDAHDHTQNRGSQIPFGGLAPQSVGANELRADAVQTVNLLDAQVTTSKITNLNVTTGKLADNSVTFGKVAKDGNGYPGVFQATGSAFTSAIATSTAMGGGGTPTTWTETLDLSSWFDISTGRFTPLVKGVYQLSVRLSFAAATDQQPYGSLIYKNGTLTDSLQPPASGTGATKVANTLLVIANGTTDYFQAGYFTQTAVSVTPLIQGFLVAVQT